MVTSPAPSLFMPTPESRQTAEPAASGRLESSPEVLSMENVKISVRKANFYYGPRQALFDISLDMI
ncbi:MAG: hypothetical protein HGA76_09745, partial [Candidatus Firestonebacteria bacterium]|nr:hypothetical protein [Candidatus Firestonebacteria bacterium]